MLFGKLRFRDSIFEIVFTIKTWNLFLMKKLLNLFYIFSVTSIAIFRLPINIANFAHSSALHGDDSSCRQFRIELEHVGRSTSSPAGSSEEIRSKTGGYGLASQARNHPDHVNNQPTNTHTHTHSRVQSER